MSSCTRRSARPARGPLNILNDQGTHFPFRLYLNQGTFCPIWCKANFNQSAKYAAGFPIAYLHSIQSMLPFKFSLFKYNLINIKVYEITKKESQKSDESCLWSLFGRHSLGSALHTARRTLKNSRVLTSPFVSTGSRVYFAYRYVRFGV